MSTHKNIDKICLAIIVFAVLITVLFMNGKALGLTAVIDEDAEAYEGTEYFTANDLNGSWDTADAVNITLSDDGSKVTGNGAYVNGNKVVIAAAGKYVVSGSLSDGTLSVDAYDSSKVFILLNGVNITCSDDAAFRVENADKVFLTLAEGSENSFSSGDTYSTTALSDGTDGTIFSHDDLTINGSGSLTVTSSYLHGIAANDDLVITDGTINITAAGDAIHVNDTFNFCGADLTISSEDDGIHSDTQVSVIDGTILISECYEGIEAPVIEQLGGDITIYPEDDGFNANGGSNMMGGGMGMHQFGDKMDMQGEEMGEMPDGTDRTQGEKPEMPSDMQSGERPEMPSDAQSGERPEMPSDAQSGERPEMPSDAQSGERPEMPSDMQSEDDAENETGRGMRQFGMRQFDESFEGNVSGEQSSSDEIQPSITISGGTLTIINDTGRDADGIDSNGDITITGGIIKVSLIDSGSNCAIDYASEGGGKCTISGGTVIACGSSAMAEGFDSGSSQCSILYNFNGAEAGETFTLKDTDGNILLTWDVPCSFSSVNLSCPEMKTGETYTVSIGSVTEEVTPYTLRADG